MKLSPDISLVHGKQLLLQQYFTIIVGKVSKILYKTPTNLSQLIKITVDSAYMHGLGTTG